MYSTPLVGRERELAWLDERFDRMVSRGEAQFVHLRGTDGAGKTRLIAEFQQRLKARGLRFRAAYARGAPVYAAPFDSLVQILQHLSIAPSDVATLFADEGHSTVEGLQAASVIANAVAREQPWPALPSECIPSERALAFRCLFVALAHRDPLLLVFDELHRAEEETGEVLQHMAAVVTPCRLMVLVAAPTLPFIDSRSLFAPLELPPLSADQATQLLRAVLGGTVDPDGERVFVELAKGDPLHVEELAYFVRGLNEEPLPEAISVPTSPGGLIGARLAALTPGAQEVARAASVIGEWFSADVLQRLVGRAVEQELATLERRGFVQRENAHYRFRHAMVCLCTYTRYEGHEELPKLNRLLGEMAEREDPAGAAEHFRRAGDAERARQNWLLAALGALEQAAYCRARLFAGFAGETAEARYLEGEAIVRQLAAAIAGGRAADVLSLKTRASELPLDDLQAVEVELAYSRLLELTARYDEALAVATEVQAKLAGRSEALALVLAARATRLEGISQLGLELEGDSLLSSRALPALRKALALLEQVQMPAAQAARLEVWEAIGQAHEHHREHDDARRAHEHALLLGRECGDQWWIARCRHNLALVHLELGDFATAVDAGLEALAGFEQVGDHAQMAVVLSDLGLAEAHRGDYDRAVAWLARSAHLNAELGHWRGARASFLRLTNACARSGKYEQAMSAYEEWLAILDEDERQERPMILVQQGLIHLRNGDYAAALAKNEAALAIYQASDDKTDMADCLNNIITIRGDCGEYMLAEAAFFRAALLCQEASYVRGAWEAHWRIAEAYADSEPERARHAAQEAREWARIAGRSFADAVASITSVEVGLEVGDRPDAAALRTTQMLAAGSERPDLRVWAAATLARALARLGQRAPAVAALAGARHLADSAACPYRFRLKFLLAEAEVRRSKAVVSALCRLAREKGARPMLARGLHLAGRSKEARQLARDLDMQVLLARLGKE